MAREIIHKKLKEGTLVRLINNKEVGIITRCWFNWGVTYEMSEDPHCYAVLVRGKEVSVCREGLTIIGES
jgi:hypothetical protein